MSRSKLRRTAVVLGWALDSAGGPRYWVEAPNPKAGHQSPDDLVSIEADRLAAHTVVVAQSGSGKSYFLGRLIEEIMLRTRARCLIFDPNGDFRRLDELRPEDMWTRARYDTTARKGDLPHELSAAVFRTAWNRTSKHILSGDLRTIDNRKRRSIAIWWPALSADLLISDGDPVWRTGIHHCHRIVQALADMSSIRMLLDHRYIDPLENAEQLIEAYSRQKSRRAARKGILARFDLPNRRLRRDETVEILAFLRFRSLGFAVGSALPGLSASAMAAGDFLPELVEALVSRASASLAYVSSPVAAYYFAKAKNIRDLGLLAQSPVSQDPGRTSRLVSVDLPSLPDYETRSFVVSYLLEQEWRIARDAWATAMEMSPSDDKRVPVFIVVDEAHNLAPRDPVGTAQEALGRQFRTLLAEGRKYGLFTILVTQRPDKLDRLVVSECDNKAIMRLGSASAVAVTRDVLGMDGADAEGLERVQSYTTGKARLSGRWTDFKVRELYTAARRTQEGGRDLRSAYWARPG